MRRAAVLAAAAGVVAGVATAGVSLRAAQQVLDARGGAHEAGVVSARVGKLNVVVMTQNMGGVKYDNTWTDTEFARGGWDAKVKAADIVVTMIQEAGGGSAAWMNALHVPSNAKANFIETKASIHMLGGSFDQKVHVSVRKAAVPQGSKATTGYVCLYTPCRKGAAWVKLTLGTGGNAKSIVFVGAHLPMDGKQTEKHEWALGNDLRQEAMAAIMKELRKGKTPVVSDATTIIFGGDLNYRYVPSGEQLEQQLAESTSPWHGWHELGGSPTHYTCRFAPYTKAEHSLEEYVACRRGTGDHAVPVTAHSKWPFGSFAISDGAALTVHKGGKEVQVDHKTACGSTHKWRPMSVCDRVLAYNAPHISNEAAASLPLLLRSDHNAKVVSFTLTLEESESTEHEAEEGDTTVKTRERSVTVTGKTNRFATDAASVGHYDAHTGATSGGVSSGGATNAADSNEANEAESTQTSGVHIGTEDDDEGPGTDGSGGGGDDGGKDSGGTSSGGGDQAKGAIKPPK